MRKILRYTFCIFLGLSSLANLFAADAIPTSSCNALLALIKESSSKDELISSAFEAHLRPLLEKNSLIKIKWKSLIQALMVSPSPYVFVTVPRVEILKAMQKILEPDLSELDFLDDYDWVAVGREQEGLSQEGSYLDLLQTLHLSISPDLPLAEKTQQISQYLGIDHPLKMRMTDIPHASTQGQRRQIELIDYLDDKFDLIFSDSNSMNPSRKILFALYFVLYKKWDLVLHPDLKLDIARFNRISKILFD